MIAAKLIFIALVSALAVGVTSPNSAQSGIGDAVPGGGVVTNVTKITGVGVYYTISFVAGGDSVIIGPF